MVNEFEPKKGFYKLFNAEQQIRLSATMNKNSYQITIFACCRQLYDEQKMKGFYSQEQVNDYYLEIDEQSASDEETKEL